MRYSCQVQTEYKTSPEHAQLTPINPPDWPAVLMQFVDIFFTSTTYINKGIFFNKP